MLTWIDTLCQLHADVFSADLTAVLARASAQQVRICVIPSVQARHFSSVQRLAHQFPGGCYTLGIHPLFVYQANADDLRILTHAIEQALPDPHFVGLGEIGLDGWVKQGDFALQKTFFEAQCRLAREFDLPVLCHVRRAQDLVLSILRRFGIRQGVAHAFNGSFQQADAYIQQGIHLGFGGAWTFTRALQLRRLAKALPLSSIVLETDSPDMSPAWWHPCRNEPAQLARIGAEFAQLRDLAVSEFSQIIYANSIAALPRLRTVLDHLPPPTV